MNLKSDQLDIPGVLPDHASEEDDRGLDIDKVGIKDLAYPIDVLVRDGERQSTVARITMSVSLPKDFKGTHMSRFIEVIHSVRGELTVHRMLPLLEEVQRRLNAHDAFAEVAFPFFMTKRAPVSGVESLMQYDCMFNGAVTGDERDFVVSVVVPVKSLCPCSKAVSDRGAHNQRSHVTVRVRSRDFVWIEDIVEAVEKCASAPLYALLKREDEKYVTELAYDNPKFVEDLVRDVVLAIKELPGVSWLKVFAENHESIHNHAAFAEIEWSEERDAARRQLGLMLPEEERGAHTFSFAGWLRDSRAARKMSQQDLASALDVSASHLSRIESGEKSPSLDMIDRIALLWSLDATKTRLRAGILDENLQRRIASAPESFLRWASLSE